jgi:hypothetical protein
MKGILSTKSYTKVWCFAQMSRSSDLNFRTQHALSMAEKDDYILIYGNKNMEFIRYYANKYNLKCDHILFTPGLENDFDEEIYKHCLDELATILKNQRRIYFVPRQVNEKFLKWMVVLTHKLPQSYISYFGDSLDWQSVLGSKEILHPRIDHKDKSIWEHYCTNIKTPRGFICISKEECIEAWKRLRTTSVVLKPTKGSGGFGVKFVNNLGELKKFDFPKGKKVSVEENLEEKHKRLDFYAMSYDGIDYFGKPVKQIFKNGTEWTGSYTCKSKWNKKIIQLTDQIACTLHPRGFGGFDFCVGDNKEIYVLDINTGRFTGSHIPILYMKNNDYYGHFAFTTLALKNYSFQILKEKLDSLQMRYEILAFSEKKAKIIIHDFSYKKVRENHEKVNKINWENNTKPTISCFGRFKHYIVSALARK